MRRIAYLALLAMIGCGDPAPQAEPPAAKRPNIDQEKLAPGTRVVLYGGADHEDDLTVAVFVDKSVNPIELQNVPAGTHAEVVSDPGKNERDREIVVKMTDGPLSGQAARVQPGFLRVE